MAPTLPRSLPRTAAGLVGIVFCASARPAGGQSFAVGSGLPSGSPANAGYTENVDFADVDHDGDRDCIKAEGGDFGNQQNRLWLNRGGLQGGAPGDFQDETAARFPAVLDSTRDADFVDFDHDGDDDLYVTNSSSASNQSSRWWVNMGGAQAGTAGFFQEQTSTRWINIAVNNGSTTFSSIPMSQKLASGGFVDWSCDCVLGDLDNDGDMDLFHSTYGSAFSGLAPSRVFRNDGAGAFEEFNPSGFQLSGTDIASGNPGLWAEGVQSFSTIETSGAQCDIAGTPLGVEFGDLDGDYDLDIVMGSRNELPRVFRNRLNEVATLRLRDVTFASFSEFPDSISNYEQELGDFDEDSDLDLYGVNWPSSLQDCTALNNGAGTFGAFAILAGSTPDDSEADWFDFNGDGRLDAFVTSFNGRERLYRSSGPSGWTFANVTTTELPADASNSLGADTCDVDLDGDYDVLVANENDQPEVLLRNVGNVPDTTAPRVPKLQQTPNRAAGPTPTVVRAHVYGNSSWDVLR